LADGFDRARYESRLATHHVGRALLVRERTASTNDDAWEAFATLGDGVAVLALEQTGGRGREGRRWSQAPGRGLALSVALRLGRDVRQAGIVPLAAGLATLRACHALGVPGARLKWPNDVRVGARKLAGVLCELKRAADAAAAGGSEVVVIGVGLNVGEHREDFPDELADGATSLALEGAEVSLADAAAEVLNQMEPIWHESQEGDRAAVLAAWSSGCDHWGSRVTVRTPAGSVEGVALRLDPDGGLVLRTADGRERTVFAGDVLLPAEGGGVA
jgi:BirA family transcriptional regulator, biotin operon repressor / biotin---[acetyl-CoA-carboxylase] ligase